MAKCPICNSPADLIQENWPWSVECDRCGIFKIEEKALITYNNLTSKKKRFDSKANCSLYRLDSRTSN